MPPSVCRGCANPLSTCNAGVDIFRENASRNSRTRDNAINRRKGIELITGLAVSDTDGLPERLCDECDNKLEGFLAFRTQLLTSLRVFRGQDLANCSNDAPAPEVRKEPRINECTDESSEKLDKINAVDEDVESEIDVCSGEDDEVLELDIQCKKNEIYEVDSSGESDIQVCDYEPTRL